MNQPTDAIRVGTVTIPYSNRCHGWRLPDGSICHNPILLSRSLNTATSISASANYFRRGIEPDSGIRGKRMSEEEKQALIEHAKSWIADCEAMRDEIPFGFDDNTEKELSLIKIALAALTAPDDWKLRAEAAEAKLAELAKRPPVGDFYEDGPGNWWQIGPHDKVPHVTPLFDRPAPAADLAELVEDESTLNAGVNALVDCLEDCGDAEQGLRLALRAILHNIKEAK